ncbi:MAG: mucoidy inhibitor MuiA family protein [Deferrisomatales bacterium]|nr:mucoidy inhibitor MuiA family protein [Deferrisomatales bacterium]
MERILRTAAIGLALLAGGVLVPAGAIGAELAAESRTSAVTVFADRAVVTRAAEVDLPRGEATVVVGGLPAGLIEDSLRVEGRAPMGLVLGPLESRPVFSEELVRDRERRLTEELQGLRDEERASADHARALQTQLAFIEALGKKLPERLDAELARGATEPGLWREAWTAVGAGAAETYAAIQATEVARRAIGEKIRRVQQELAQVATGRREEVQVRLRVAAVEAGRATLLLSYHVGGAEWSPAYDARLSPEEGSLYLDQLARVRQSTGEDWNEVTLTLSTARPGVGAEPPGLDPWFIDFLRVAPLPRAKGPAAEDVALRLETAAAPDAGALAAARQEAEVVAGEFAAEYRIPGTVTVPSDRQPHQFAVGGQTLEPRLSVRAVPKREPVGYLLARAVLQGPAPLLPGPVALFRGDTHVGRVSLPLVRPGEELELSFGADDRVRVVHAFETGERSRRGIFEKRRREERRYRMAVGNHHGRPLEVTVLDQLPVPRDERIHVELLEGSTPPTERDAEGVRGVVAWRRTYQPGEEVTIRFGYAVTYPEGETVPGF